MGLDPSQPIVQAVSPQAVQQQLQAVPLGQQLQPAQPVSVGVQQVQGPQGSAPWTANPYHPEQNVENSPAEQQRALDLIHGGQDLLKSSALKLQAKGHPGLAAFGAMFGHRSGLIGALASGIQANAQSAKNDAFAHNQAAIAMLKAGHAMVKDGSIDTLTSSQKAYTDQQNQFQKNQETAGKNDRSVTRADSAAEVAGMKQDTALALADVKQQMQQSGFEHDDAKVVHQYNNKLALQNDQQQFQGQLAGINAALQSDRIDATTRQHLLTAQASIANNLASNNTNIEKHNADILAKYYKPNPKTGKSGFYNEKGEPVDPAIFMIDHQQAPQLDAPQQGQSAVAGKLTDLQAANPAAHPAAIPAVNKPAKVAMHIPARVSHGQNFVPPPPPTPAIPAGAPPPAYTPPQNLGQVAKTFGMTPEQTKQKFVEYATKKGMPLQQAMQLASQQFGK